MKAAALSALDHGKFLSVGISDPNDHFVRTRFLQKVADDQPGRLVGDVEHSVSTRSLKLHPAGSPLDLRLDLEKIHVFFLKLAVHCLKGSDVGGEDSPAVRSDDEVVLPGMNEKIVNEGVGWKSAPESGP